MARRAQDVTNAELAVLEVLWDEGTITVRRITDRLYPNSTCSQHATVQKLLDRLKAKEFVDRDRLVWPHLFKATVTRDELIGRRLGKTVEKLCNGSLQPLLSQLFRESKLNKTERDSLRKLLDQLDD